MTGIVVLGSTNMDLVAYVARAPKHGETVTGREFRTVPGGKGANQAVAAARAGGDVAMIGAVGDDEFGVPLRHTLTSSGVDTDLLHTAEGPPARPTSSSTTRAATRSSSFPAPTAPSPRSAPARRRSSAPPPPCSSSSNSP